MGGEYGAMGGMGGEYGAMGGMGGGYGGGIGRLGRGRGAQLDAFTWDGKTSSVLLRYFDNSVESGRRYRYRVRLVLRDVHNMVPVKHLDKSVIDRRESKKNKKGEGPLYRFSEWSEPSPIASVPLPARLYVVGSTPAKETNFYDEPEAEVLIKSLNSEFASEVAATEEFTRGSVVNIEKKAAVIWTSSTTKQEYPEFLFRTGITVLGFTGGEKFSKNRNLLAPTRALLMDPAGRLFVQSELKDQETLEEFQAILEKDQDGRGRNPYGRGGYEGEATGPQGFGGFGGEF